MSRRDNQRMIGIGTIHRMTGPAVIVALVGLGVGATAHADEPVETGEIDGATVAVGLPPVPPAPTAPTEGELPGETGEVDGATVAVGLPPVPPVDVVVEVGPPPVPTTTMPPETGEVDGAIVAVGAPPVPTTTIAASSPAVPPAAPPAPVVVGELPETGSSGVLSVVASATVVAGAALRYLARLA